MKGRFVYVILNIIHLILCAMLFCFLLEAGNSEKSLFGGILIGWWVTVDIQEIMESIAK